MKQLKALCILLFALVFISVFCGNVSAKQKDAPPLSPALSVITSNMQMKKSGLCDNNIYFTSKDFEDYLNVDCIGAVTITSLPSEFEGALYIGDTPVIANQTVNRTDLKELYFKPTSDQTKKTTFYFSSDGTSCESSVKCTLYLLEEINSAPTISQDTFGGQRLSTQKNIMVYSTLQAEDAENDTLSFEIKTETEHGIVSITDDKNGSFSYTPALDYTGKDRFEYFVYDEYGNRSDSAWVEIVVEKNEKSVFFTDMLRHKDHNDAVKAANYNIMSGVFVDGKLCFSPESTPTKAEFLAMALKASGSNGKVYVSNTGFDDDSDIPSNLKKYVAYAVNEGIISGTKTEQGVFFYPNSPITRAEAAVIVSNIINAESYKEKTNFKDLSDIPSWAEEDIMSLAEMNIMEALSDGSYMPNEYITNIQAAAVFCNVYEKMNK